MTPTQPSQAVEAAERKEFDKLHMRGEGAPSFRVWSKWNEHEKRIAWEAWLARAELARPRVAAVGDADVDAAEKAYRFSVMKEPREKLRDVLEQFASQRVPVALPQKPIGFIAKETLSGLQNPDWQMQRNTPANLWSINNPPSRAVVPVYIATPSPNAKDAERYRALVSIYGIEQIDAAILARKATAAGEGK